MGNFDKNYYNEEIFIHLKKNQEASQKMLEKQCEKRLPKGNHNEPSTLSFKELMESL